LQTHRGLQAWSTTLQVRQPLTLTLLLLNSFTERQTRSMEDYIETSVMVQYNNDNWFLVSWVTQSSTFSQFQLRIWPE